MTEGWNGRGQIPCGCRNFHSNPKSTNYFDIMLRKLLYCGAIVALLASCNEDFDDWAQPQTNEQQEAMNIVATALNENLTVNLAEAEEEYIKITDIDIDAPEGFTLDKLVAYVLFEAEEEGAQGEMVPIEITSTGTVAKEQLQSIITNHYGKRPDEREAKMVIYAKMKAPAGTTTVNSNQVVVNLKVTPEAPVIDSAYYLVGDMLSWGADNMLQFNHSDADVYEDPVFTVIVTTTAENQYWKIIPQSNVDGDFWSNPGVVGPAIDGDASTEGTLVNQDAQAGKIEQPGKYRITINMMDYTYKIEQILFEDFVYFIGATDGWQASEQRLKLQNEEGLYTGYVYCADPNGWGNCFKFQRAPGSWDNEINSGTFTTIDGDFGYHDGDSNIQANAGEGVYYVQLDLGNLTLSATKVNLMGIIGDFNSWGGDVEMTWNPSEYCFEASRLSIAECEWKFRVNGGWGINLGGDAADLVQDGGNLFSSAEIVRLYPTRRDNDNIYAQVSY